MAIDNQTTPKYGMRITLDGEELFLAGGWEERRQARKRRRMKRNQAFIARCERLTGKRYETYAEAIEAWDEAGLFLPWRRWRAERSHA